MGFEVRSLGFGVWDLGFTFGIHKAAPKRNALIPLASLLQKQTDAVSKRISTVKTGLYIVKKSAMHFNYYVVV